MEWNGYSMEKGKIEKKCAKFFDDTLYNFKFFSIFHDEIFG